MTKSRERYSNNTQLHCHGINWHYRWPIYVQQLNQFGRGRMPGGIGGNLDQFYVKRTFRQSTCFRMCTSCIYRQEIDKKKSISKHGSWPAWVNSMGQHHSQSLPAARNGWETTACVHPRSSQRDLLSCQSVSRIESFLNTAMPSIHSLCQYIHANSMSCLIRPGERN